MTIADPTSPVFVTLKVVPSYRDGAWTCYYRDPAFRELVEYVVFAPDELGAYAEMQPKLDVMRQRRLGRRWKYERETSTESW